MDTQATPTCAVWVKLHVVGGYEISTAHALAPVVRALISIFWDRASSINIPERSRHLSIVELLQKLNEKREFYSEDRLSLSFEVNSLIDFEHLLVSLEEIFQANALQFAHAPFNFYFAFSPDIYESHGEDCTKKLTAKLKAISRKNGFQNIENIVYIWKRNSEWSIHHEAQRAWDDVIRGNMRFTYKNDWLEAKIEHTTSFSFQDHPPEWQERYQVQQAENSRIICFYGDHEALNFS